MPLRRSMLGALASGLSAVALAACGGGSSPPLQQELSYLPANSPVVLVVQTGPNTPAIRNTMAFIHRFPFAPLLESAAIALVKQAHADYQTDIRPLLGNPVALAVSMTSTAGSRARTVLGVWVTHDATALDALVHKSSSGFRPVGTRGGATIYLETGGRMVAAVDGATLVLGPSVADVDAALNRHAHGGGLSPDRYTRATRALPSDALLYAFGDFRALVAGAPRKAGSLPWIRAVRTFGVSISANSSGARVDYRLDTAGSSLTAAQLPLAGGQTPPGVVSGFPLIAGLRDPRRLLRYLESAERSSRPARFAAFRRRQARLLARTGADVNQLIDQLTGSLVLVNDTRADLIEVGVGDGAATARTLARLARDPADAGPHLRLIGRQGGFYLLRRSGTPLLLGVVGSKLLIGEKAKPAELKAFAELPTAPAAGARGAGAFSVALPELIALAARRASSQIPPPLLSSLGNLTGWVAASRDGIYGTATLAFR